MSEDPREIQRKHDKNMIAGFQEMAAIGSDFMKKAQAYCAGYKKADEYNIIFRSVEDKITAYDIVIFIYTKEDKVNPIRMCATVCFASATSIEFPMNLHWIPAE